MTQTEKNIVANQVVNTNQDISTVPVITEVHKLAPIRPKDFSDAGNAEIFATRFRGKLIWCDALGWLWWDGKRWVPSKHKAKELSLDFSEEMLHDAEQELKRAAKAAEDAKCRAMATGATVDFIEADLAKRRLEDAKPYLSHAKATRNFRKLEAMEKLAKALLVVPAIELDADPNLLNTKNGVIHLPSGAIFPHDPKYLCTRITTVGTDTHGTEQWETFLRFITCNDSDLEMYLQLVCGMALYGRILHEGVIFAYGSGRNGKSTFFNVVASILGDYAGSLAADVLTAKHSGSLGAELATLRGKRYVVTGELEENDKLSASTLKRIASTDTIRIEVKYKDPEDIKPSHSLIIFTNHLPRVASTDQGTWRRLAVIPFRAVLSEKEAIADFAEKLIASSGGAILQWCIDGAVLFAKSGFKLPNAPCVEEATSSYQNQESWVAAFLSDRCHREKTAKVRSSALYAAYREWALATHRPVYKQDELASALEGCGFHRTKPQNVSTWHGLDLIPIIDEDPTPSEDPREYGYSDTYSIMAQ